MNNILVIENSCNQKCLFCSADDRMKGNNIIELKKIFLDVLDKGEYIQISGGEPLLRKDLYTIMFFIRKHKKHCFIELQTNGTLLLKNNNLDKLQKFNINLFNINYPCHIEEINDQIIGVSGLLKSREKAMSEIIKRGLNLRINIVINKLNYIYLPEIVNYVNNKFSGTDRIQFSFTKIMGAVDKNTTIIPSYEEVEIFLISALEKCKNYNIKVDVDHIPMCYLGKYYKNHVDYKKIMNHELGDYIFEKTKIEKCIKCNYIKFCSGFRIDYLKYFNK